MTCLRFRLVLAALIAGFLVPLPTQAQEWTWARSAGDEYWNEGRGVALDAAGNAYVAGRLGGVTVAKYGPDGVLLWPPGPDPNYNTDYAVVVDASGNPYFTGMGGGDVSVTKYDPSGTVLWARRDGGEKVDEGYGIGVDAAGNTYVTGRFGFGFSGSGTATFGAFTLTPDGSTDTFVVKYDAAGEVVWARNPGVSGDGHAADEGHGIAVDAAGNAYVTGFFSHSLVFGEHTLTSAGARDAFVVKYGPHGDVLWARSAGGAEHDRAWGIATDAEGNAYVTGSFRETATFGPFTVMSAGSDNVFVAKYGPNGDVLWVRSASGVGDGVGSGIAVDAAGDVYVTGGFEDTATFGPFTIESTGYDDVFVAKYSPAGDVLWVRSAGGAGYDEGYGIAVGAAGDAYVTGRFAALVGDAATFGPFTITSAGDGDAFVARLGSFGTVAEDGTASSEALLLSPLAPHPAAERAAATLTARHAQRVRVVLYDVLGREVALVFDGALPAGAPWPVEVDVSALPPGMYILRVAGEGAAIGRRIVVAR